VHPSICHCKVFLHSLLNVLLQIANKMGLQEKIVVFMRCHGNAFNKSLFFLIPKLFTICKNTFSKWWEGLRMSCRRVLSSTPLLVRGSETV
jgi:hypothetical protein